MNKIEAASDAKAAFCIFRTKSEVETAKTALESDGFSAAGISVLYPTHQGSQDFPQRQKSSLVRGSLIGSVMGGIIFLSLAVLIVLRALPVHIIEQPVSVLEQILIVIGILMAGIILGAAAGALIGIGTPQVASNRYSDYVDSGGILFSVHVNNRVEAERAKTILERIGASDINLLNEERDWKTIYKNLFTPPVTQTLARGKHV